MMDLNSLGKQAKEYVSNGQSREAISLLEKNILTSKSDSVSTEEYDKAMIELCDIYNDLASELLESKDSAGALVLLRRAESITVNNSCKARTLNTLACYYRQIGKARIAENYLLKALELQTDLSSTHLNLCAVLSELGKHEEAMMQAMSAVILLQHSIILSKKHPESSFEPSMVAIAYLNLGVELEFLKRLDEALGFYKRSERFAAKNLPAGHMVALSAKNAVKEVTKKLEAKDFTKGKKGINKGY